MIKKILAAILAVMMIFSVMTIAVNAKKPKYKKDYDNSLAIVAGVVTYLIIDDVLDYIEDKCCEKDYVPVKYPYYLKYPVIIGGKVEGYYVDYDSNGGTKVGSQYYQHGQYSEEPEEPVLKGYKFGGWYADENCIIKQYEFDTRITMSFTLYAKWIPN